MKSTARNALFKYYEKILKSHLEKDFCFFLVKYFCKENLSKIFWISFWSTKNLEEKNSKIDFMVLVLFFWRDGEKSKDPPEFCLLRFLQKLILLNSLYLVKFL